MNRLHCTEHDRRLVWNETVENTRQVGGVGWEAEETEHLAVYVCPEPGCHEHQLVAA